MLYFKLDSFIIIIIISESEHHDNYDHSVTFM